MYRRNKRLHNLFNYQKNVCKKLGYEFEWSGDRGFTEFKKWLLQKIESEPQGRARYLGNLNTIECTFERKNKQEGFVSSNVRLIPKEQPPVNAHASHVADPIDLLKRLDPGMLEFFNDNLIDTDELERVMPENTHLRAPGKIHARNPDFVSFQTEAMQNQQHIYENIVRRTVREIRNDDSILVFEPSMNMYTQNQTMVFSEMIDMLNRL